ncbi:MAG: hypothetical protein K2P08_05775 [Oscillospiraceae bacterium]|nr:hypothetical protein [Oscillospiraceae bacterium]
MRQAKYLLQAVEQRKSTLLACARCIAEIQQDFFRSRGLGGETGGKASPDAAKALLKELIQQEDKARPLSDQKLCGRMAAQGCAISRRTVAKYRGELQIPGMSQRRTKGG